MYLLVALLCLLGVAAQPPSCGNPTSLCLGVSDCDPCAIAEVSSTTQGVTLPRLTSTQRLAIASPAVGLVVFDITAQAIYEYFSTGWVALGTKVEPSVNLQEFTSNGTWTKPANALLVQVWCIGGGGGGDSAWAGNITTQCVGALCVYHVQQAGGSGGAPGAVGYRWFLASDLPSTLNVSVGVGGTGGNMSANFSLGLGQAGGTTAFGPYLICPGGGISSSRNYTQSIYDAVLVLQNLTIGASPGFFYANGTGYFTPALDATNATFPSPTAGGAGSSCSYTVNSNSSANVTSYALLEGNAPSREGAIVPLAGGATTLGPYYVNAALYAGTYIAVTSCVCQSLWTNASCGAYVASPGPTPLPGTSNSGTDWGQTFYAGTGGQGGYPECCLSGCTPTTTTCANWTLGQPGGNYGGGGGGGGCTGYNTACNRGAGGAGAGGYLRVVTISTQ